LVRGRQSGEGLVDQEHAMAFLAIVRDNLLVRASVATVAGFVLLGVASGALPVQCFTGIAACRAVEDAAKLSAKGDAAAPEAPAVHVALNEAQAPTLTQNDVIASTFAMLEVDLEALQPGELSKRVVRTVAIGPDGQPIVEGAATPAGAIQEVAAVQAELVASVEPAPVRSIATAASDASPLAYASDAPVAKASSAETATTDVATADPVAPVKAKAATGSTAVVKGSGVNVRTAPSKGKSKVLFALAPGAVVTINDNQRGWLKVTDAKGRSGWVYQDFVSRQ
jgi:hypothetical protein